MKIPHGYGGISLTLKTTNMKNYTHLNALLLKKVGPGL
jgi:hypothetical protein